MLGATAQQEHKAAFAAEATAAQHVNSFHQFQYLNIHHGACREEQEVLEAAARQEHKAALAAAAATARDAKQDLQQMQMAAQRMAWRTRRWQVAHLRRHALQVSPHPCFHCFLCRCSCGK